MAAQLPSVAVGVADDETCGLSARGPLARRVLSRRTMHPTRPTSRLRSLSLVGVLLAVGCASTNPDAGGGERTGAASEAVDLAAIPANQAAVVQDFSTPARATGAVFVPFLDPSRNPITIPSTTYGNIPLRGSCGVTFVSPHYAITASHCFADANANPLDPNLSFTTMSYDVTQANVDDFYFDAAMQGTFPNYAPIFGHMMTQAVGYTSTTFTCKIASRCPYPNAGASSYNCENVSASDVTMLYCAARPAHSLWLPIASEADQSGTGAVAMYWFHELFMTNNNPDMIAHYTAFTSHASNWHYLAAPTNAFLPFKSVPWSSGVQRGRFGSAGDGDVRTDLYGCHGTSGSGVLSLTGGSYALLGPVHRGLWSGGTLCDDPKGLTQGGASGGLTYNSNASVNNLVNMKYAAALQNDRFPPPVCGDGVCNGSETHASCPRDCACGAGKVDCCGDGICRSPTLCQKLQCL
jgi:hypothetical protein